MDSLACQFNNALTNATWLTYENHKVVLSVNIDAKSNEFENAFRYDIVKQLSKSFTLRLQGRLKGPALSFSD